ncbi:hypothetical protein IQ250_22015, partial [Pseudanabaenaceae cyanobacterium LEGE 13415]|nr:hypothetical protein [Pseudanabaenaceae cyanobacterium LEGE 13415]
MDAFDNKTQQPKADGTLPSLSPDADLSIPSKGASTQATELEKSLNQALPAEETQSVTSTPDDHDHGPVVGKFQLHVDLNQVADAKTLDSSKIQRETSLRDDLGAKGDYLNPKEGK